jgi:hypothetical protein
MIRSVQAPDDWWRFIASSRAPRVWRLARRAAGYDERLAFDLPWNA